MIYRKFILGDLIKIVDKKNKENIEADLLGINIDKYFMPSVANVIGTDITKYKVISYNQFSYNPMHIGRDRKLPIALYQYEKKALVSPAYYVFEIKDNDILIPEFLMLLFKQDNFDHYVWFHSDSSVRGSVSFTDFCNLEISLPDIPEQKRLVKEYHLIENKINQLNEEDYFLENLGSILFLKNFNEDKEKFHKLSEYLFFEKGIEIGTRNYSTKILNQDYVKYYRVGDTLNDKKIYYTHKSNCKNKFLDEKDIAVTFDGTLGRTVIGLQGGYSSGIRKIYSKGLAFYPNSLIYWIFKSPEIQRKFKEVIGTSILHGSGLIDELYFSYQEDKVLNFDKVASFLLNKKLNVLKKKKILIKVQESLIRKIAYEGGL